MHGTTHQTVFFIKNKVLTAEAGVPKTGKVQE